MKQAPLFSVVTITYNNCDGLQRTGKSTTLQSSLNYEWVIIDGASNDATNDYLNSLKGSEKIHITSEPDNGIYDAMNKGIARASGDYIIFMNAGDVFSAPDILETIEDQISDDDFIYGDALERNDDNNLFYKPARPYSKIDYGMMTHHQSMLYRRVLITDLKFNADYKIAADYDFTRRFLTRAKNIRYMPLPICIFEAGGISQIQTARGRSEQYKIRRGEISVFKNATIYGMQAIALFVKQTCPRLYRFLRK